MAHRSLLAYIHGALPAPVAQVIGRVDLEYALQVARRVASFGTYERGFRPAGTEAARRCAEYLAEELRQIGLPEVRLQEYPLDGWEFAGARVEPEGGPAVEAAAYGGATGTPAEGIQGELVDCGFGTLADYERVHAQGKIALIEMDLEALNWPGIALLEAAQHGAIGVVCWPANHYAMTPGALHCHDLQVQCPVPMLNVSREDGRTLRQYRHARLFSSARALPNATGRNIVGIVPGTELPDEMVIIGDHYDAWFDGFMDDAVGVGAVLALARAVIDSGYRPRRTLAFVLHDAEEYGQADSPWDWCTGAFAQVTRLNPEWVGKAIGAVIFELCGFKMAPVFDWYVSPELATMAEELLERLQTGDHYPLGKRLNRLVTAWEDAFSYSVAGIPSAANLEIPEYVRSHYYHTQFDSEDLLDIDKYGLHVAGLGALAFLLDQAPVAPFDFTARARDLRDSLPQNAPGHLFDLVEELERLGDRLKLQQLTPTDTPLLLEAAGVLNRGLVWLGGEGMDETMYPHEQPFRDLVALNAGELGAVTGMGWGQNVSYPVYRRQLFRHTETSGQCWKWATGRVSPYFDVWHAHREARPVEKELVANVHTALQAAYEHDCQVLAEAVAVLRKLCSPQG